MSTEAPPAPPATPPATPPANQPFYSDWLKPDGKLNNAALDRLPEDIRYLKDDVGRYGSVEDFMRGYAQHRMLNGKKGLIPLDDKAPAEVRAERKQLLDNLNGVPKEAKDYGIARPADFPEAQWSQPLADAFAQWAHENSVSPTAAKKLVYDVQVKAIKEQLAQQATYETNFFADQAKQFETAVRASNMPLDKANALVERAAAELGFDLTKEIDQRILKNATVRMALVKHAVALGEDSFVAGDPTKGDVNDALAMAQKATHDKTDPLYEPLHNAGHPQHRMAVEKVNGWYAAAVAKQRK